MPRSSGYWAVPAVCCSLVGSPEAFWYPGHIVQWGILLQERNQT